MFDLPGRLRRSRAWTSRGKAGGATGSLAARVEALEEDMQEARRLNRRLAELMDVVEELLVPLSQQDHERVEAYLASNTTRLDAGRFDDDTDGPSATGTREQQHPERG
ncbi:DUF6752 domain-containing protein [Nocardioides sp. T2.26MG-1]|uniref:DUF6752 domain-containing protein n=1 Tax=Nocardioides sp. T2.26MG-1 TaxID=3041166 RepID=UPI00247746D7|nr:DUF6752 domain-containing protein [Nocardioides sp. T2.26MG-1]CAI9408227.1 hypothetical protein HIDPHFAB_01036 [Nocardioides sp. T2.26MG-1]